MIRRAEPKDLEAVLGLAKDFVTSFVVDEDAFHTSFAALLAAPHTFLAVAEREGQVIGYVLAFRHATFYANGHVAWVEEVMVQADCRRQGVGQALMQSIEDWAVQQGCKLIALATRRAAPFYAAIGYEASATYFRKVL